MYNTTDASFVHDVLNAPVPVLVDFWADWCGPCKVLAPTLEQLDSELEGHVSIAKVDTDANPELPKAYGIRSIPTVILFHKGEALTQIVGAVNKQLILDKLAHYKLYPPSSEVPI
jgi:thioredoxin 1|tara:strand:- start:53 stop:397 length:345 start_codon:yes stop_codon:yes gene_type:complete